MANLLWKQTVVSQIWLAEKLHMKSAANVGQQLRKLDLRKLHSKLPPELATYLEQHSSA